MRLALLYCSSHASRPSRRWSLDEHNVSGIHLACEKVSIPWSTRAASTGTSALASAAADFFFPLSFFAIGGGESEVQVAVMTLAKQCYGKWRSGRLIATMHTTLVLVSFSRDISIAKHGA